MGSIQGTELGTDNIWTRDCSSAFPLTSASSHNFQYEFRIRRQCDARRRGRTATRERQWLLQRCRTYAKYVTAHPADSQSHAALQAQAVHSRPHLRLAHAHDTVRIHGPAARVLTVEYAHFTGQFRVRDSRWIVARPPSPHRLSCSEIFLGNTFSSYISVINQYTCDLRDVGLTANIQCANDRVDLHDNRYTRTGRSPPPNPMKVLPAGSSLDMVVDYPLNQVGNHVLRVGVTYVDPITNEPKSLRKFYRFAVQNPLVISFKHAKQSTEESFVEAQIRNVSKLPLFVDSIRFMPIAPFTATEFDTKMSSIPKLQDEASVKELLQMGPQTLLNPQEEVQRVFRIAYDSAADQNQVNHTQQPSQNLGRLHIGWKTAMGEAGSVQSQPVVRKADTVSDVTVKLDQLPKSVHVGVPFVANAIITNHSPRPAHLQLQFRKEEMAGIMCSSVSHQNLPPLGPKSSTSVFIEFLPTVGGLQVLRGAVCLDVRTGQEYRQEPLAHLMVHVAPSPPTA